jgi:hypothetical protein
VSSNNYSWNFQILPGILPAKKKKATEYHCNYQMQTYFGQQKSLNISVNAISTEHNRWLCTVPLHNTNGVPPGETHLQICFKQSRTTVNQFKYWGYGASENLTMYMTIYTQFKIQGTDRNYFNTTKCTILQSYIVYIKHPNTASPELTQFQVCNLKIQTVLF